MPSSRPKIAVICAYNPGNAGMYSVDLAARKFFSSRECDFDLFVSQIWSRRSARLANRLKLYRITRPQTEAYGLTFRLYHNPAQLSDYSHVVYWGDFTNNPAYGVQDFSRRHKNFGYASSRAAAMDKWKALFALTGGKPAARVVSAGQNFQYDYRAHGQDFSDVFDSLAKHFDHILPRDPYSVANLSAMLPANARTHVEQGLDCAFLLDDHAERDETGTFCFKFARSGFADVAGLVRSVEAATGLRPVHLEKWIGLPGDTGVADFARMRQEILGAHFVLTDTYHVCVNALTQGVPTYCLGRATAGQLSTTGDFKKKVLFDMMQAEAFYFEHAEDDTEVDFFRRVEQSVGTGTHLRPDVFKPVRDIVRQRTEEFRSRLDAILFD